MKKFEVKAHNIVVKDGKKVKVLAGIKVVDQPESLAEAVKLYGEQHVVNKFWDGQVIAIQSDIRRGVEKDPNDPVTIFKGLSKEEQQKIILNRAGV